MMNLVTSLEVDRDDGWWQYEEEGYRCVYVRDGLVDFEVVGKRRQHGVVSVMCAYL